MYRYIYIYKFIKQVINIGIMDYRHTPNNVVVTSNGHINLVILVVVFMMNETLIFYKGIILGMASAIYGSSMEERIEAATKWHPFPRRHFQMYLPEWKCVNFD